MARPWGGTLADNDKHRNRTPAPRGTVEDWLASRLSQLGAADDDETDVEPTVDQDPRGAPGGAVTQRTERPGTERPETVRLPLPPLEDFDPELESGEFPWRHASEDVDISVDLDEDDAATVHDDGVGGGARGFPAGPVTRAPTSPELPLLAGSPTAQEPFDPVTDRFDARHGFTDPGTGAVWDPDAQDTPLPEGGPWDEVDPRSVRGGARADEETGVLLQRTDPSISQDPPPETDPTPFGQVGRGAAGPPADTGFVSTHPPHGFLDLPLAGEGDEPHTQWEQDVRAPGPDREPTHIRYTPSTGVHVHRILNEDGEDDEMPTVIARPGQFPPPTPPPAHRSQEPTAALDPMLPTMPPAGSSTPPTRPLPAAPPAPPPRAEGNGYELVWIGSAVGGMLALVTLVLLVLGWLSMQ